MTTSIGLRLVGKTTVIAVTTTASTPVLINTNSNDQINWAEFANTGASAISVAFSTIATDAVHPVAGTPADYTINENTSVVLAVPSVPYYVSAIAPAGSSTLYVTPVDAQ
ncbi:hypothetical protein UFOVP41_3 [uncultured Caudovirales phage]|uniref:Uncharacterized protein n=1 Tax=uncultured Caudovirales phage TaxID=2100421 RepID=A0A6J5KQ37_9CAUD|nr:hypothetical protein UFOVP41_3 [uncultured Caudovirales phage]